MLNGSGIPKKLEFSFKWGAGTEAVENIRKWIEGHKDARLVVIDILQRVRRSLGKGESAYTHDYESIKLFQRLAGEYPGLSILIVHHNRKMAAEDHQDGVSGTTGLTGAADAVITLERKRGQSYAIARVSGRGIDDVDAVLTLDKNSLRLTRHEFEEFLISESRKEILDYLRTVHPDKMAPVQIAKELKKEHAAVRKLLRKMEKDGQVLGESGKYRYVKRADRPKK